jgi:ankyrin repeat protein
MPDDATHILEALTYGDIAALEEYAQLIDYFPEGTDLVSRRRWMIHAIDIGTLDSVRWILGQKVVLNFVDAEGYSPLHSAIDRNNPDRYEILTLLLENGANPNLHGFNDWTPAHLAAARDDVSALKILVAHAADLTRRTRIDDYNTPLEEARLLKKHNATAYLESLE